MTTLFRTETADRLARLSDPDREAGADLREVHSLKGAAATVGAERVAALAQAMETRLRGGGSLASGDVLALAVAFAAWQVAIDGWTASLTHAV